MQEEQDSVTDDLEKIPQTKHRSRLEEKFFHE
jgi:hypothetical protein